MIIFLNVQATKTMDNKTNIHYLKHDEIDFVRWDQCVSASINHSIYAYSWYLNLVSGQWDALVEGDYQAVFPLPFKEKAGIRYICMPPFTQQLGLFSHGKLDPFTLRQFILAIPNTFRLVELNLNTLNKLEAGHWKMSSNRNFELDLILEPERLRAGYAQNLRRNLLKANVAGLQLTPTISPSELINLFRANRGRKINTLDNQDYLILERLMHALLHRGILRIMGATYGPNSLMAGLAMVEMPSRSTLLFSASERKMNNHNALAFLIDAYIEAHAGSQRVLDFEGSNDPDLGRYYAGFGAQETSYPSMQINHLTPGQKWGLGLLRKWRRIKQWFGKE